MANMKVTVKANSNIALVKYWGKKNERLKTPLNNSISITLDKLYTVTSSEIIDSDEDEIFLNGNIAKDNEKLKIIQIVDLFRNDFQRKERLRIKTENNFPTASGLASSASGFAALASVLGNVFGLNLDAEEVSRYARIGSGSACRSVYGGFSEWLRGEKEDGGDSYAVQLASENYWDIRMLVVIAEDKKKSKSSTDGMEATVKTCPFYPVWLETINEDLKNVREGILSRDIEKVGRTMEYNCLKMHSTMFTTRPAIIYWKPATLAIIHKVYELREEGISCYYTIDAGPNVKILCLPEDVEKIKNRLSGIKEIKQIIDCKAGKAPEIVSGE